MPSLRSSWEPTSSQRAFEIEHEIPVEFIVAGGEREDRRAAFEDGLAAIYDAIKADSTLGGSVDNTRMLAPRRNGAGLYVDGMPNILGADIRAPDIHVQPNFLRSPMSGKAKSEAPSADTGPCSWQTTGRWIAKVLYA